MRQYLPAVCLSSFLPVYKNTSPAYKEPAKKYNIIHALNSHSTFNQENFLDTNPGEKYSPLPALRVVAVKLVNNTEEVINLKKALRVSLTLNPEKTLEIMPPALSKKQATSVYFLYNLLHQRLSKNPDQIAGNSQAQPNPEGFSTLLQTTSNVFLANTQDLDVLTEVREANIINKTVYPGQTMSGLILLFTTSATPLQFFLNI